MIFQRRGRHCVRLDNATIGRPLLRIVPGDLEGERFQVAHGSSVLLEAVEGALDDPKLCERVLGEYVSTLALAMELAEWTSVVVAQTCESTAASPRSLGEQV